MPVADARGCWSYCKSAGSATASPIGDVYPLRPPSPHTWWRVIGGDNARVTGQLRRTHTELVAVSDQ